MQKIMFSYFFYCIDPYKAKIFPETRLLAGDDCISIVSNSSRLRIKNIVCGPGHGIRYS